MPIAPEEMVTKYMKSNKTYNTIGAGEINILKDNALREIYMTILLPNDINLPFVQKKYACSVIMGKPILYLSKFREIRENKKPIQLLINRQLADGSEAFEGNILVTIEEYTTREIAFEQGSFYVDLVLKEYRHIKNNKLEKSVNKKGTYVSTKIRTTKKIADTYKVRKGDNIWAIAKRELNDGSMYKKIMEINGITDPKSLKVGAIIKLK